MIYSTYFVDFTANLIAAILFALIVSVVWKAISSFAVYYVALNGYIHHACANCTPPTTYFHFHLASLVILCFSIFFIKKLISRDPFRSLSFVSRIHSLYVSDSRIFLLFNLWYLTIFATSVLGMLRYHSINLVSDGFYVSWIVNVMFFAVVGLAAAVIGLRSPEKEEFENRLAILFAAKNEADADFKRNALTSISKEVRKIGFVYSLAERRVTINEYNAEYEAFRAYVTIKTSVVNLFGDVDAEDDTQFSVTPDKFDDKPTMPDEIGQIVALSIDGEEKITGKPIPILQKEGGQFPTKFSVGREQKNFVFKYWCWFRTGEEMGYTPSRFCREFSVTVVNRMRTGEIREVLVGWKNETPLPGEEQSFVRGSETEVGRLLQYGEELQLKARFNIDKGRRVSLFHLNVAEIATANE